MKKLTTKQARIWALKESGRTNKEIAADRGCSENYISKTITVIHRKLGMKGGDPARKARTLTENAKPEQAAVLMDLATDPFAAITKAIKESGLPTSTGEAFLRRLRTRYGKPFQAARALKTAEILGMLNERIHLALQFMDESVMSQASFRDLALGTTAMIEKRQLLSGEPTAIISDLERKKLHELLPLAIAEARRRGLDIPGEYKVLQPEPLKTEST